MIERTITLDGLDDLAERMDMLRNNFAEYRDNAVMQAMTVVLYGPIRQRTPESAWSNPTYQTKEGKHLPSLQHGRKRDGWRPGTGNLAKSIKYQQVIKGNRHSEFSIFSEGVPYAEAVHDLGVPGRSERGLVKPINWSKPGSGNLFIEKPVEEHLDEFTAEICNNIDSQLMRDGIA